MRAVRFEHWSSSRSPGIWSMDLKHGVWSIRFGRFRPAAIDGARRVPRFEATREPLNHRAGDEIARSIAVPGARRARAHERVTRDDPFSGWERQARNNFVSHRSAPRTT